MSACRTENKILIIFLSFSDISLGEAKECIKSLDPNKPMSEIQQVMLKGFSSDDDQVVISTERFIKCLERADISQSEPLN